jgi:hypothetical protein
LSASEISQLYNNGNGLYANTSIAPFNNGLVAGWHLDEATTASELNSSNALWDDNLVSLWHLNDDATDAKGTNDGTWSGTESYATGLWGNQAGDFNDDDGDYISIEGIDISSKDFTLAVWAKLADPYVDNGELISQGTSGGSAGLLFSYFPVQELFMLAFYGDSGAEFIKPRSDVLEKWFFLVGTYKAETNDVRLYLDGILVGNGTTLNDYLGTGTLYLGTSGWNQGNHNDQLKGVMQDAAIWNRTLSAEEVASLYSSGVSTTSDITGNNNGTIWGATLGTGKVINNVKVFSQETTGELALNLSLSEGVYNWSVTALDNAGNSNTSETRILTIDSNAPYVDTFIPSNNSYTTANQTNITVTISDETIGIKNATLNIYNSTNDLINSTFMEYVSGTTTATIGIVIDIVDGVYSWMVDAFDWLGNHLTSLTYMFTRDTTPTQVNALSPDEGYNSSSTINYIAANLSDSTGVKDSELFIYNSSGALYYNQWQGLGNAIEFSGDDYVSLPYLTSEDLSLGSVNVWVKQSSLDAGAIIAKGDTDSTYFMISSDASGKISISTSSGTATTDSAVLADGAWHMLTFTKDYVSAADFTKTNYGSEVDSINGNVAITRGTNSPIYNPLYEGGWSWGSCPYYTEWNADGYGDLSNVASRSYTTDLRSLVGSFGSITGYDLVMHTTDGSDEYYKIDFSWWQCCNEGGGFTYTRQQIGLDNKIYVDGVEQTLTGTTSLGWFGDFSGDNYKMGMATGTTDNYFEGQIDDVMFFNRTLSQGEIDTLYNSGNGLYPNISISPYNSGLIAGYRLDERTGDTTSDLSGNSNTATLVNTPTRVNGKTSTWGTNNRILSVIINTSTSLVDGRYSWAYNSFDLAGNVGTSGNRTLIVDTQPPVTNPLLYIPNLTDNIDPGVNIQVNATILDTWSGVKNVTLQVKNNTVWTNYTMYLASGNINNGVWQTNFTLSEEQMNYTINVYSKDFSGNANKTTNLTFESAWDCTWNLSQISPDSAAGYDENKYIGYITLNNTGDVQYHNNNCSIKYTVTHNGAAGEIYFDNDENMDIYVSKIYNLAAKEFANISINYSFGKGITQKNYMINASDYYKRSITASRTSIGTVVTNKNNPYLLQRLDNYPAEDVLYLTPQNISLGGYFRNIMGSEVYNISLTAFNTSIFWNVSSYFTNVSGNLTNYYDNISTNTENRNDIEITFSDLGSMSPGTYNFTLNSIGYNYLGSLIEDASNNTILTNNISIIFNCYTTKDGVCVSGCGIGVDPDCNATTPGGGSGGGTPSIGRFEKSNETFELIRGKAQKFSFQFTNKYEYGLKNLKINVKGINSEYISIDPKEIKSIASGESKTINVEITAPAYFTGRSYDLIFTIEGKADLNKSQSFLETKVITLYIVEYPKTEATQYLDDSNKLLEEMNNSGMKLDKALELLEEINKLYSDVSYGDLKNKFDELKAWHDAAFESKKIIEELKLQVEQKKKEGISVSETEKMLTIAEVIYNRGDYLSALDKLKQAKLVYASEVKGEFNLAYAIKNHPVQALLIILAIGVVGTGTSIVVRLHLLKKKLIMLKEEEVLLLQLMKVIQRECFENNRMSMEEYGQAMTQYEDKLSTTIQDKVQTETKIANLLKVKGKKIALEEEKKRLLDLIKQIQDDYLNKGKIETRIYENMVKSYSSRLSEVQEKIAFFDAQEALNKGKFLSKIKFWRK